jgi:hypothetical protein
MKLRNVILLWQARRPRSYTPHTLKFGFRYKKDFRDNKDFKDMINNKNCCKNRIFKCNEYIYFLLLCFLGSLTYFNFFCIICEYIISDFFDFNILETKSRFEKISCPVTIVKNIKYGICEKLRQRHKKIFLIFPVGIDRFLSMM